MTDRKKGLLFLGGGLLCFLAALGLVMFFSGRWKSGEPTVEAGSAIKWTEPLPERAPVVENTGKGAEDARWVIYITGAVKAPGVYKMSSGVRIYQVVDMAGGFTPDADAVAINMARPLQDGDHVHVPARTETSPADTSEITNMNGVVETGESVVTHGSSSGNGNILDLNRCSAERLESLPGVGPKTAAAIVLFREEHGFFRSVDDLVQVKGIGPSKMNKIRDFVTVGR